MGDKNPSLASCEGQYLEVVEAAKIGRISSLEVYGRLAAHDSRHDVCIEISIGPTLSGHTRWDVT
jgi:hypothetical protein